MKQTLLTTQEWEDAVQRSPLSTIYQTPLWASLLEQSSIARRPECYRLDFESGRSAIIPGMYVPKFGGLMSGWYSMPMGYYGGPLFDEPLISSEWTEMCELFSSGMNRVAAVFEVSPGVVVLDNPPNWIRVSRSCYQAVRLERDFDEVFGRFAATKRNIVRRGRREGLAVVDGRGDEDCRAFKTLYGQASSEWTEALPPVLLDNLLRICLREDSPARLRLVVREGRCLAAGIFLYYKDQAISYMTAYDKEHGVFEPTTLLYSDEMKYACERGCRTFNFGSSLGIESLERFKTLLGAEKETRYRIVCRNRFWRMVERIRHGFK